MKADNRIVRTSKPKSVKLTVIELQLNRNISIYIYCNNISLNPLQPTRKSSLGFHLGARFDKLNFELIFINQLIFHLLRSLYGGTIIYYSRQTLFYCSNDLATRKEVKVSLISKAAFAELIKTMSKFRICFMFCRIYSN